MRKSIKLLSVLFALVSLCLVFTGCDNGSGWEPSDDYGKAITITFVANGHGTAPAAINARANQEIEMPQMAPADGYVNTSWYLDAACQAGSKAVGTWQKFTKNTTLYGYWTNQKFNIVWNVNDPDVEPIANTTPYAHSAVAFPVAPVHPDGYDFMGWYTTADGRGEKVAADYEITKDEEFFAQWGRPVTVAWSVNGSTDYYAPADLPAQKNCGAVQFPTVIPVDTVGGKPFGGWYDADGNAITAETIVHGGETFYAKWGYAVTLDKNGGDTDGTAGVVANGTALSITTAPAKAGYVVMSYYTDSGCTERIAGADGKLVADVSGLTDGDGRWIATTGSTFYAKWGKKLGGTIYYVNAAGYGAANYTFYDADGNQLAAAESGTTISFTLGGEAAVAAYYDVTGKTASDKDRYYVAGAKLAATYPWTFGQTDAAVSTSNYFTEDLQAALKAKNGNVTHTQTAANYKGAGTFLGVGKLDTETMLYHDPIPGENSGGIGPYAGGKYAGKAYATMDKYPTAFTVLLDYRTTTGIDDWFIPSAEELYYLAKNVIVRMATGWISGYVWSTSVYGANTNSSWCVIPDGSVINSNRYNNNAVVPVRAF